MSPATTELTVAGVTLHKHDGGDYHYYRAHLHELPIEIRPTLSNTGKPLGWRCYAVTNLAQLTCLSTGETLTLAIQRADYSLKLRAEARRPKP